MKLKYKLTLAFVLVTMVPILLITGVSLWQGSQALRTEIGIEISTLARSKAEAIGLILQSRITEAQVLAETPEVRRAVSAANAAYEGRDEAAIKAEISDKDETWIREKKAGGSPLAKRIFAAPLSQHLAAYTRRDPSRYGEIFLTDRRGGAVAITKILSDYDQADEGWWEGCFAAGEGAIFVDDRGFDETVGALVVGVVVPVRSDEEVIGVLKINFKVRDVLDVVAVDEDQRHTRTMLVREQGSVVIQAGGENDHGLTEKEQEALADGTAGSATNSHGPEQSFMGYGPVKIDVSFRVPNPGERKGISGELWVPSRWWVFVEIPLEVAFASLTRSLWLTLGATVLALLCALLLALAVARTVSRPIQRLHEGTEVIGGGDLDHRVGTDARDEIGQLARAFDSMVEQIQAITASRDELDQLRLELERSNRDLEQFAYVSSHDLQEPLRTVTSFVQLLASRYEGQLDEKGDDYIRFIVDGATRMKQLINDLLAYSRVGSRSEPAVLVACQPVLDEVLDDLSAVIKESDAQVSRAPLPEVLATPMAVRQLLHNLVGNALKYRGDAPPEIHIAAVQEGGKWRISVRDNGIGVKPEYAEKIFVIFERLHTAGAYPGTGIGLAICKRIVERFDGRIWVDSEPSKGSTFHFTLPANS